MADNDPTGDQWLSLLSHLPLSRSEREVTKRYESDPLGRSFLPIADILRAHRHYDEAIELLILGVERHPKFTVARVVLTRELYQKGLIFEAWRTLEDSPLSIRENALAQKLRLRMSILFENADETRKIGALLVGQQMLDDESRKLLALFESSGIAAAKAEITRDFQLRSVVLPVLAPPSAQHREPPPPLPRVPAELKAVKPSESPQISGFHVVPLPEIFHPNEPAADVVDSEPTPVRGGLELDSTTLADIYAKQGLFTKSLAIYRRLERVSPNNEMIRRRIAELSRQERLQREENVLAADTAALDKLEQVQIIDAKIKFLTSLLERL